MATVPTAATLTNTTTGTVFTKVTEPNFLTAATQLTTSYSIGGINFGTALATDPTNYITPKSTGPIATFTLTRISSSTLITNLFKSTTVFYARVKTVFPSTYIYTDGVNMAGGNPTKSHSKTRSNRKQFKKTRKSSSRV